MSPAAPRRVAVLTGGASGIGRACALAFAAQGHDLAIADRDDAEEVAGLAREHGVEAFASRVDVSDGVAVERFIAAVWERFGRLDCGVNAAGIQQLELGPTAEVSDEVWEQTIGVNLDGIFYATKHEIRAMLRGGGGAVVNVASQFGLVAGAHLPAYVAAKHGVVGLSKAAALDYATSGVRVNVLCPGGTDTPLVEKMLGADPVGGQRHLEEALALHPMRRLAEPQEIAAAAVWLCSEQASNVTGVALPVDGGYVAQ